MSNATKIGRKRIPLDLDVADGQVIKYDDATKAWVAVDVIDLPIDVDGITATTIGTALAELLAAIAP